jgi:AmiR/NasT family two-component response regulator
VTAPRLIQNFKGGRALIVTPNRGVADTLEATLAKLGVSVERPALVDGRAELDIASLQAERDILFLDGDLDGAVVIDTAAGSRLPPVPIIGLVGVEAPSRLKALMQLGATGFLRKPVHGAAVYTALFLGVNQFLLRSEMQGQLEELGRRRQGRRFVIKAVVLLMQQTGLDDDAAYALLRRESMRSRQGLESYCEQWLGNQADTAAQTTRETAPRPRADQA